MARFIATCSATPGLRMSTCRTSRSACSNRTWVFPSRMEKPGVSPAVRMPAGALRRSSPGRRSILGRRSAGCNPSNRPVVAMADGVVVRSETGVVMEDLDGDGDERTGWDLLYLHIATVGRAPGRPKLKKGDPIGFPSCEGGEATGTHVHIARKYNGEWMPADSVIPFNLEGWIAHNGDAAYQGYSDARHPDRHCLHLFGCGQPYHGREMN